MTARVQRINEAVAFAPEGHTGVRPVRLIGTEPDDFLNVVLSEYAPGAHADWSPVPVDTVYLVLSGSLAITYLNEKIDLRPLDSIFLPAGCMRAVDNLATEPARMLVMRPSR